MRSPGPTRRLRFPAQASGAMLAVTALLAPACSGSAPTDPSAFCDALRRATAFDGAIAELDIDDAGTLDGALVDLRQLADEAPAEINESVETVVAVYDEVLTALASTAPGARADVLRDLQPRLDTAAEPAAALQRYGETTCRVRFTGPEQPTPTPTPLEVDD